MKDHPKPRVRFCWVCGKKLWGNHHVEVIIDEHLRILHETCYEDIKRTNEYLINMEGG